MRIAAFGRFLDALDPGHAVGIELVERLVLEQRLGQTVQPSSVLAQLLERAGVALIDDPPSLRLDQLAGRLRERIGTARENDLLLAAGPEDRIPFRPSGGQGSGGAVP